MLLKPLTLRQLGNSSIRVSPIGLGTAQFSAGRGTSGKYWPALDQSMVCDVVNAALRGGVTWFDTAEYYGEGASEHSLADALYSGGKSPGEVMVATKWWPVLRNADSMKVALAKSLKQLDGFSVDLYQVHQPWSRSTVKAQMTVMAKLHEAGHIKAIGVSNFSARGMRAAHKALSSHGIPLASNQVHYSLLNRKIERNGVMDTAKELGVGIIAWSPLEQGLLTGKFHRSPDLLKNFSRMRKSFGGINARRLEETRTLVEALETIAARYEATPAQVALNWLVSFHGDTVFAIPGASRPGQARDNIGAMQLELKNAELVALDELSRRFM